MTKNYKDTLNLPKTEFPMKANLPVREKEMLDWWEKEGIYDQMRKQCVGKEKYVLHDGPPFANGEIHLGHVLNKTLKDIVVRYKTMKGYDAPYVPGWDCHGLPIEYQVTKSMKGKDKNPANIRQESTQYANKFIQLQKEQFIRLGVWGDWDKPYITMNPEYEAEILRLFADLVEKGYVYEGYKPVYWSTGCRTALAEAEVEYMDRTDSSIYVKFPVYPSEFLFKGKSYQDFMDSIGVGEGVSMCFSVWTTTPWTLPANLAIAVHPDFKYHFAYSSKNNEVYIILDSRLHALEEILEEKLESKGMVSGQELENAKITYQHPFLDRLGPVLSARFVTAETGSGVVHIAPGHGHDDYALGQSAGLDLLSPVDDAGKLTDECGMKEWVGLYVLDANAVIIQHLEKSHRLLAVSKINHSYPHCWRSKTPIVFRSVKQWFIRVDAFKDKALEQIDQVQWFPDWGKNRIQGSVGSRQDWCISRQRSWGVPIPVFYKDDGEALLDAKLIRKVADSVEKEGTNIWFEKSDSQWCQGLGLSSDLVKGKDTLDVWIDSGSSFRAVLKKQGFCPADLYLEGSDQHRGWFQSSLLLASASEGYRPYKSVLTHGFVVDGNGKKMSKSLGNVIAPMDIIKRLGADVLRLWVVASDYSDDIRVSKDIFDRISDTYRKFRNTLRYLLGNLDQFNPDKDSLPIDQLVESDRWALSQLAQLVSEATACYEKFQYHRFYQLVYNFCIRQMSSIYFDTLKDRLYTDARSSISGRSARTTLFLLLDVLTRLLAPILPFTCEEAWQNSPSTSGKQKSVHMAAWPTEALDWRDEVLEEKWIKLLEVRELVLKELENKREKKEIGNSLEAEVQLSTSSVGDYEFWGREALQMEQLLLVSSLSVDQSSGASNGIQVQVTRSSNKKCSRCWIHRENVGSQAEMPDVCQRCFEVIKGL